MDKLRNKVALVTGGSMGIGFATAALFTDRGTKVVILGHHKGSLINAKNEISPNVDYFQADISNLAV